MKKFLLHTFGCQMNVLDSERIADLLQAAGWRQADGEEDADLVLFNTCCVRKSAENRAIGRLTLLKPWKKKKPGRILGICGCIAQKDGNDLLDQFPFLDLVVGTRDFYRLPAALEKILNHEQRLCLISGIDEERREVRAPRSIHGVTAFVTIMYGCNNFCSYCIVPYVRGREISRSSADIIKEISSLVDQGVKEVCLLGQNVNSYREKQTGLDFPDLLAKINEISGLERIRYTTSHPRDASHKLVEAAANLEHVCENFHLPAQAGSDHVLSRMRRGYTSGNYLALVKKIRELIPDAVITTDLMVGFPGETDEDFEQTMELCRKVRWDSAFTFIYSIRPGTEAASWKDDVSLAVKKERVASLIRLQESISEEKNRTQHGTVHQILVERRSRKRKEQVAGRDRGGRTVVFEGSPELIGSIVPVRIVNSTAHTLIGEAVTEKIGFAP